MINEHCKCVTPGPCPFTQTPAHLRTCALSSPNPVPHFPSIACCVYCQSPTLPCCASLASPFSLTNSHLFTTPPLTHLHLRTLASPTCVLQPFITINALIYNELKSINVENCLKLSKTVENHRPIVLSRQCLTFVQ